MEQLQSAAGLVAFLGLAWLISENRRAVRLRLPLSGVALTAALAVA
ncbi:MAG: nucleoside:proton symporter, partial [Alphaproteobacteria bacterium]|nr:nucleoside:proton symporter [Alphaproteobacteria bacterium]